MKVKYVAKPYKKNYRKKRALTLKTIKKVVNNTLNRNIEKKRINRAFAVQDFTMGQVAGNANGFFANEITPLPNVGTSITERIGTSIKITGAYMTLQLRQMSAAVSPVKLTFYIFRLKGNNDLTASDFVVQQFNTTEYISAGGSIYDTQSSMNIDYLPQSKVIKKINVYIKPDQFTGQQMPAIKTIGLKFKKPLAIKYDASTSNPTTGRFMLIGFASNGNASTTTASTLANVPVSAINTGQFINYNIKWYYQDA